MLEGGLSVCGGAWLNSAAGLKSAFRSSVEHQKLGTHVNVTSVCILFLICVLNCASLFGCEKPAESTLECYRGRHQSATSISVILGLAEVLKHKV
jgi:hypothetical protein